MVHPGDVVARYRGKALLVGSVLLSAVCGRTGPDRVAGAGGSASSGEAVITGGTPLAATASGGTSDTAGQVAESSISVGGAPSGGSADAASHAVSAGDGDMTGEPDGGDASCIGGAANEAGSCPGECTINADCPMNLPVCGSLHSCQVPSVTPPSTLTYASLIVTNEAYADAFRQLAQLHTLTGVPTQVVTIETICGASSAGCQDSDACNDTSKVTKDYLSQQYSAGLRHVVLGGDMTIVPSRKTTDSYSNALLGVSYNETFYTDYYFADLSQWDTNGDCIYGDPTNDSPDYLPELDVTRISVSSPSELQVYIAKVEGYLTAYDTAQIDTALFLSNIATQLTLPSTATTVPLDSALYFETPGRTLSLMPGDFAITKLYASPGAWPGASAISVAAETAAFEQGVNLVVHAGHGDVSDLTAELDGTDEFSGAMAGALQNSQYPIMVSCACDAATFADGDGCAGQNFITAPEGGGVGYLGNSTLGLGIAGGMQFIDQFLKYTFATSGVLVGEAVKAGHANLPTSDSFAFSGLPLIGSLSLPVVDANSWRWTEKAATYLGDGLLPIYTSSTLAAPPTFAVTDHRIGDLVTITIQPTAAVSGSVAVAVADNIYQLALTDGGGPVSLTVGGSPTLVTYGFASSTTLASYQQVNLP
ncbi:MAG: C25 family cysteine peptidase [Polyangia bacterium]